MSAQYPRLDAIVNNACQTIRRPPAYYSHLMPLECAPTDSDLFRAAMTGASLAGMPSSSGAAAGDERLRLAHSILSSYDDTLPALLPTPAPLPPTVSSGSASSGGNGTGGEVDDDAGFEDVSAGVGGGSAVAGPGALAAFSAEAAAAAADDEYAQGVEDPIVPGLTLPDLFPGSRGSTSGGGGAGVALLSQLPVIGSDVDPTGGDAADNRRQKASTSSSGGSGGGGGGCGGSVALVPAAMLGGDGCRSAFKAGALDVNEQQVDTRLTNSWLLKLDEVSTGEAAEVRATIVC